MDTKTIYKQLAVKNANGEWYEVYTVEIDFPLPPGFTAIAPPEDMRHPKGDGVGNWVEDKDSIIEDLTAQNAELTSRVDMTEGALLDLADMILTR